MRVALFVYVTFFKGGFYVLEFWEKFTTFFDDSNVNDFDAFSSPC